MPQIDVERWQVKARATCGRPDLQAREPPYTAANRILNKTCYEWRCDPILYVYIEKGTTLPFIYSLTIVGVWVITHKYKYTEISQVFILNYNKAQNTSP